MLEFLCRAGNSNVGILQVLHRVPRRCRRPCTTWHPPLAKRLHPRYLGSSDQLSWSGLIRRIWQITWRIVDGCIPASLAIRGIAKRSDGGASSRTVILAGGWTIVVSVREMIGHGIKFRRMPYQLRGNDSRTLGRYKEYDSDPTWL